MPDGRGRWNAAFFELYPGTKDGCQPHGTDKNVIHPGREKRRWLRPLTKEETDQYSRMIAHTRKIRQTDWQILNTIQEEAGAYFAGDHGLDETVDIIQNRVATYVNESR